jgi:hypothetical protein
MSRSGTAPDLRRPSPPSARGPAVATVLSVAASIVVDLLLVKVATSYLSSTRGDVYLRPVDYGSLTIVGVVGACATWTLVERISPTPPVCTSSDLPW